MFKAIGYDPSGIPRVWAIDDYDQTATGFAREEAEKYLKRRPDTGPLDKWRFHTVLDEPN